MNVSFPLRDGYFRPLNATRDEQARWKQLVEDLVTRSLHEENPYYTSNYTSVDKSQWKLMRSKDQLRVYKPVRGATAAICEDGSSQCLLEIGTIEGTLEDVIYGVHHTTTADMRATTSFLSGDALDSAVLHVFENGVEDDLFRSFALKWRILETPAGSLVKNRDICAFEYMGIAVDPQGDRFAFHICESFDHPVCPPFHVQAAVRATTHTRVIYRQLQPGRVGMYYRGEYSTGGKIPSLLARWTAAEVAVSIRCSVDCAEAKKLTAMALECSAKYDRHRQPITKKDLMARRTPVCGVCALKAHRVMHMCQVCGATVCGKCRSKKHLLSDQGKVAVACCMHCIVVAKSYCVDPRQPLALISAMYATAHGVIQSATAYALRAKQPGLAVLLLPMRDEQVSLCMSDDREMSSSHAVYDLLAGMSLSSDSTDNSMASSREEIERVESTSSGGGRQRRPASASAATLTESEAAYVRMNQLRLAAQRTYIMTRQNSNQWIRNSMDE